MPIRFVDFQAAKLYDYTCHELIYNCDVPCLLHCAQDKLALIIIGVETKNQK